jgi:hypothetical protein
MARNRSSEQRELALSDAENCSKLSLYYQVLYRLGQSCYLCSGEGSSRLRIGSILTWRINPPIHLLSFTAELHLTLEGTVNPLTAYVTLHSYAVMQLSRASEITLDFLLQHVTK